MGQITTGVGLVSGLNFADIVDQLIKIEERPKNLLSNRNEVLGAQQTAFQEINANLLSLKLASNTLASGTSFSKTKAFSSDESILTASSTSAAAPGNYTFRVAQLVGSQQTITRGFLDTNATAVAPDGAVLTFERGEARLESKTDLAQLNGGEGVKRGHIRITDRSGATAVVDLTAAVTVDDVIDRINQAGGVNVIAQIDGDGLTVTDASGGAGTLAISNVGASGTASSLGLAGSDAGGVITGGQINRVGRDSLLATLNDGNGVGTTQGSDDLRITTAGGGSYDVNLEAAVTLGDVIDTIEAATGGEVTGQIAPDGKSLTLTDTTGGGAGFAIASLNGSAAADLGLVGDDSDGDGEITGRTLIAGINSKLLRNLNGGNGLAAFGGSTDAFLTGDTNLADLLGGAGLTTSGDADNDLEFFARDSTSTAYGIDLDGLTTVQELIDAVNTASAGKVQLSIVGDKLRASDASGGEANFTIQSANNSLAATELGLAVDAQTSSVLGADLDPAGSVAAGGTIRVTNSAGGVGTVDLTAAASVSDVIKLINDAGLGVTASLNQAGNGLRLTDDAGGAGDLTVADDTGVLAQQLGLAGTFSDGVAEGKNLQFRYITESTRLDQLGVAAGKFRIQDSGGASATVDLTQGNEVTLGDVISEINSRGLLINARINDTGDGILIEDTGPGSQAIEITEEGSSTAKDLGLLGKASTPGKNLDGSFERVVAISSTDTLNDVAQKIGEAKLGINAGVINDGSVGSPYRLSLSSQDAGANSAFVFDDGGLGLGANNLAEARDAVVFFGSANPAEALTITASENKLQNVIPGVTIDLLATSERPVQVTINRDTESLVNSVQKFVEGFNKVTETLDKYDTYNAETEERGLLLGDGTVLRVRSAIFNAVLGANNELSGQFNALSQVGIKVGQGARLQFDQDKFLAALETDSDAVEALFSFEQFAVDPQTGQETEEVVAQGIGKEIDKLLARLTDGVDGTIQSAVDTLQRQIDLNTDRIESIDEILEAKRARLEAQFIAMERALAEMQGQGTALAQIQAIQPVQSGGGGLSALTG